MHRHPKGAGNKYLSLYSMPDTGVDPGNTAVKTYPMELGVQVEKGTLDK